MATITAVATNNSGWGSATSALSASDNVYANTIGFGNSPTPTLFAYGFDFSGIPAGSTINGITLSVEESVSTGTGFYDKAVMPPASIGLTKNGTSLVSDQGAGSGGGTRTSGSDIVDVFGGSTFKWGTTWTVADLQASTFGALMNTVGFSSNTGAYQWYVDQVSITVDYTPPPPPSVSPATNFPTAYNAINVQYSSNIHLSPAQNLYATDGSLATAYNTLTDWDVYSGFGLNIPSTATIDGLVVTIRAYQSLQSGSMSFNNVQLYDASTSTAFGADRSTGAAVPSSLSDCVFGSATDKWTTTLTPALLNSPNFAIGIRVSTGQYAQANVDSLRITVYFTVPGGASTSQMFLIF